MTLTVALDLVIALLARSQQISQLIQKARAEGRDTLTAEEWKTIDDDYEATRARLVAAIGS